MVAELLKSKELMSIQQFKMSGEAVHLMKALKEFSTIYMTMDENEKIMEYESSDQNISDMLLDVSVHFEDGAVKYGENNWQKGIPVHCYIDSAVRHYLKYTRGDEDEPHERAFVWNLLCCIWTVKHKPELNEYRKETVTNENFKK